MERAADVPASQRTRTVCANWIRRRRPCRPAPWEANGGAATSTCWWRRATDHGEATTCYAQIPKLGETTRMGRHC